uniref:Reverse transcriptase domain-containing protein n=1 Tax=Strongyloides papillosus TaxID=174720 RepID=A0A0N5BIJ3_STREA
MNYKPNNNQSSGYNKNSIKTKHQKHGKVHTIEPTHDECHNDGEMNVIMHSIKEIKNMINDFKLNTLTICMLMICMLIPFGGCQPLGICRFAPSEFPRLYLQNNYDAKKAKQVTLVSVDTRCVALDVFASGYRLGNVFVDPDSNVEHYFDKKAPTFSCAGSHLVHLSGRNETFAEEVSTGTHNVDTSLKNIRAKHAMYEAGCDKLSSVSQTVPMDPHPSKIVSSTKAPVVMLTERPHIVQIVSHGTNVSASKIKAPTDVSVPSKATKSNNDAALKAASVDSLKVSSTTSGYQKIKSSLKTCEEELEKTKTLLKESTSTISDLRSEIERIKRANNMLSEQLRDSEDRHRTTLRSMTEESAKSLSEDIKTVSNALTDENRIRQECEDNWKDEIKRLNSEIEDCNTKLNKLKTANNALRGERDKASKALKSCNIDKDTCLKDLDELKSDVNRLNIALEDKDNELSEAKTLIDSHESQIQVYKNQEAALTEQLAAVNNRISQLENTELENDEEQEQNSSSNVHSLSECTNKEAQCHLQLIKTQSLNDLTRTELTRCESQIAVIKSRASSSPCLNNIPTTDNKSEKGLSMIEWAKKIYQLHVDEAITEMPNSIASALTLITAILVKYGFNKTAETLRKRYGSSSNNEIPYTHQLRTISEARPLTRTPIRVSRYGVIQNIRNSDSMVKLPVISINIGSNKFDALVDTGASLNVISQDAFNLIPSTHKTMVKPSLKAATVANNDKLVFSGASRIYVEANNKREQLEFHIVDKLSYDIIIGIPGLHRIFGDELTIRFNHSMPSITNVPVKTASKVRDPPRTTKVIHADVHAILSHEKINCLFVSNPRWKGSDHIMTYYQTGPVIDNKFAVILQNHGSNTVLIPANTEIGNLHSIEEVDDNTIRISGDEIIPEDAAWEDSLPNYPESHAPLTREQLMDSISWTNCTLSPKAKEVLQDIIWNNRTAFFEYDGNAGLYNGDERLNIELATSELPQRIRPGRRSREIEIEIDKQVEDMLEKGMIEHSRSPYLSRVVLVRKKDMKWRFVVDFRAINKLIKQQSHLIPRIDRLTEEASGHKYYSVFDLKQGFHQIPLDEHSRRIAAFVTHRGIYQYKVMPMGLTGSPDKFQDIMDKVLSNIPDCYIYLDDILTCSQDEESHIHNINNILSRIAEYNMKITLNKCQFGQKNAQYLGYIIDFDGIHPNPDKVKAITDKREPKTEKKELPLRD